MDTFDKLGLRVNIKKTVYLSSTIPAQIDIHGHQVHAITRTEALGADIILPQTVAQTQDQETIVGQLPHHKPTSLRDLSERNSRRWDKLQQRITRLRTMPARPQYKIALARTCISPLLRYLPLGQQPTQTTLKRQSRRLLEAVFGPLRPEAAAEMMGSVLLPGHLLDFAWTVTYSLIRLLRLCHHWGLLSEDHQAAASCPGSFMEDLRNALQRSAVNYHYPWITSEYTTITLRVDDPTADKIWYHQLRDLLRGAQMGMLALRRPKEFQHLQHGAHYQLATQLWLRTTNSVMAGVMKRWHSGSLTYREREHRHAKGKGATSPLCIWCYHQGHGNHAEDPEHILLHCPQWRNHRDLLLCKQLDWVPWQVVYNGVLPVTCRLTPTRRKLWMQWVQTALTIFAQREQQLHAFEAEHGAINESAAAPPTTTTPTSSTTASSVRRRLVGKQTLSAAQLAQEQPPRRGRAPGRQQIAESNQDGLYCVRDHRIAALPYHAADEPTTLVCLRCRRSATVHQQQPQAALRIIMKRNQGICTPSPQRSKFAQAVLEQLPTCHIVISHDQEGPDARQQHPHSRPLPNYFSDAVRQLLDHPQPQREVYLQCTRCQHRVHFMTFAKQQRAWLQMHTLCWWQSDSWSPCSPCGFRRATPLPLAHQPRPLLPLHAGLQHLALGAFPFVCPFT